MGTCLSVDDSSDDEIGCGRSARARRKQRKQRIMEVLAAEAKNNEVLFRMPGRMYLNGSSSNACIFTQQGRKGTNQDAMIVWESFASRADTTFCGVFDGHGPFGHLVAKKVRDSLPSKLAAIYKTQARHEMKAVLSSSLINGQEEKKRSTLEAAMEVKDHATENGHTNKVFSVWKDSFLKAYNSMDKELKSHPTIDCFCSGTTAVTMLLQGQDMVIANVGDSRAVLATLVEDDNTKVEAIQLTVDLKPNLPLEAERIKRCKGRVFALEDEPEVARVWLPHDDSPGLAMARAFGDFCLKDFGLIAVPEVTYTRLTERDQFIVLASDGVWDVLSNKEVVDTIWEAPTRTTAARSLVETAVRAWRLKYPTSKVDDCAVVCFYFNKQQRSWQAQASLSTSSGVVEELTGELPTTDQVAEAIITPEFNRSNTLRLGSDVGGDDVQVFVGESLVAQDKSNDVKRSKVMDENFISVTQGDIVVVEESKSTAMEKTCIRKEENVAGADDEDMSLSEDTLPSGVHLAYAEVHAIGNGETSPEQDIALHDCSIEAAASDTHHMNSPSNDRPSPEDQKLGLSEHTAFPSSIIHEEAPSEITVLSDVGEDEGGKVASGAGAAVMGRSSSRRSLAECLSVADEDEWSALEGVARVNSLLNLPRFLGGEKGGSGWGMTAKSGGKGRKSAGAGKKGAAAPGVVRRRRWG